MRKSIFFTLLIFLGGYCFPLCTDEIAKEQHHQPSLRRVNIYLIGTGVVGKSLLEQIEANHALFCKQNGLDLRIVGIANSQKMCFQPEGINVKDWRSSLDKSSQGMSLDQFLEEISTANLYNSVFVDCTSSKNIAEAYAGILKSHIAIVTPNKKACSSTYESYRILQALSSGPDKFYYDANVGAGLPIISTIKSLKMSGDEILTIEGVLSGTLSYLFNSFREGAVFSEILLDAQNKGYTEPDPRDDLNGMDVARKLLILVREAGFELEMEEIELERFLPAHCFNAESVADFYLKLKTYDAYLSEKRKAAEAEGKRLLFIASFRNHHAKVSLEAISREHPFYHLSGNDNIVAISSKHYSKNPLVIQGPGAGAEVTAAKVLEGIIQAGCGNSF